MMANIIQTGNENSIREALIYLGDADALISASDDEIWDELAKRLLEHRSIEKDGRRKNLKKKERALADNISTIIVLNCELLQRHYLRKQRRDDVAWKLALQNAAARNANRSPIIRTATMIPIGQWPKSRPV